MNALARRGINALLLRSYNGSTDWRSDKRLGYEPPSLWQWVRRAGRFDHPECPVAYAGAG